VNCSICKDPIEVIGTWESGNNAWPVNDGRCCNTCDMTVVLPARLQDMFEQETFERGER
jgi:hypothetical protein